MADVKLFCGDSLSLLPTLKNDTVDAVITDPPYGIDYQSSRRIDKERKPKIENDTHPFIWWLYDAFRITRSGGVLLCFCEWRYQELWKQVIEIAGYKVKSHVIWDRDWHGLGDLNGQFAPQHDIIWFATKGDFKFRNGRPKDVIRVKRIPAEDLIHPNEKPISLMKILINSVTDHLSIVVDPFMGSGSTGIACVETKRNFIGMEIDKNYFAITEKRIQEAQQKIMLPGL